VTSDTTAIDTAIAARWVERDHPPPGHWVRGDHFPLPLTTLQAEISLNRQSVGRAAEEFALLAPAPELAVIDGYAYGGSMAQREAPLPERVAAFEERVRSGHEGVVLRRWREEHRPAFLAELTRLGACDLAAMTDAALSAHLDSAQAAMNRCDTVHFTDGQAAALVIGRLGIFCTERLGLDAPAIIALLAGASSASNEPTARLEVLAREAVASPALRAALDAIDPWTDARVRAFLQPYLDTYGHRALDFALHRPTLAEQPRRAVRLLQEAIARVTEGDDQAADRARSLAETVDALRARLPTDDDRATFDRLLADARDAYGVRDDDVSFSMWARGLMRYALLEAGRRLAARGLLTEPEQIWYLHRAELEAALVGTGAAGLAERAAQRQREHLRQEAEGPPPEVIGTPFPPPPPPALSEEAQHATRARAWARALTSAPQPRLDAGAGTELRGAAGSAGVYTGRARVVVSEREFDRVEPGDVLVCSYSSPSWTILFGIVGAVVADEGGLLSHAGITCREYGIPCVAGTKVATRVIPDGALVTVDGTAGVVRLEE
jgi:pyruvate,water dikinase